MKWLRKHFPLRPPPRPRKLLVFLLLISGGAIINVAVAAPSERAIDQELQTHNGTPAQTQPSSTVPIILTIDDETFPRDWYHEPMSLMVTPIDPAQSKDSIAAVTRGMAKYPPLILNPNLQAVHLVASLSLGGVDATGTYSGKNIFLRNDLPNFVERTFHHEFASIVRERASPLFSSEQWIALNPAGFEYIGDSVTAVKQGKAANLNPSSMRDGFATEYSKATIDDDFSEIVQNLFMNDRRFWILVKNNSKVYSKVLLAIKLFHTLDSKLSEAYFQSLPVWQDSAPREVINSIPVFVGNDDSIFPPAWREHKYPVHATALEQAELDRSLKVVRTECLKYPGTTLPENLDGIYLVGHLTGHLSSSLGERVEGWLYLPNAGISNGCDNQTLAYEFHCLTCSVIVENFWERFPEAEWQAVNPAGFVYGTAQSPRRTPPEFMMDGFISHQCNVSLMNDVKLVVTQLFMNSSAFWKCVEQFPKVRAKVSLSIRFLHDVNPSITEEYLKGLSRVE